EQGMRRGEHRRPFKRADVADARTEQIVREECLVVGHIKAIAVGEDRVGRGRSQQRPKAGTTATGQNDAEGNRLTRIRRTGGSADCEQVANGLLEPRAIVSRVEAGELIVRLSDGEM